MHLYILAQAIDTRTLPHVAANSTAIGNILSIVFGIAGSISLLMVVIGGFRYVLANGDSNAVSSAKNTIIYAIVGLVISLSAYAIVNLVITHVTT